MSARVYPSLKEAEERLKSAIERKSMVLLIGRCRVEYRGRSSSELGWGERLTIIKPDGAVLVHRPQGYEPVNWQPPGCRFRIVLREDQLSLEAVRRAPKELLTIFFDNIRMVADFKMVDHATFEMFLTEEQLYDVIESNPEVVESGFRLLSSQKDMKSGIPDFTGVDDRGNYVLVEVKKDPADEAAVKQLYRYVSEYSRGSRHMRGIILAPKITRRAARLLKSLGLEFVRLDLKRCAELFTFSESRLEEKLDKHF